VRTTRIARSHWKNAFRREDTGDWVDIDFDCPRGYGRLTAKFRSRICDIHDFAVKGEKRKGNGRQAVLALREFFDAIELPNPYAWRFWRTMRAEGLVRDLFGWTRHTPNTKSTRRHARHNHRHGAHSKAREFSK
jgi:hypothetical protein